MRESRNVSRQPVMKQNKRAALLGDLNWRFIERQFDDKEDPAGPAICTRCHAYLETDHWMFDEQRYRQLKAEPGTHTMLCPGCTRIERRLYEGEVTIRHNWDSVTKDEVVHLIHNEEARERITNASARIALMEDRGDELYLLTTTQFLARRIGTELQKAYKGSLKVSGMRQERFSRVLWEL